MILVVLWQIVTYQQTPKEKLSIASADFLGLCYFSNNVVLLTHVCFVPCCDPSIFRALIMLLLLLIISEYEIILYSGLL